MYTMSSISAGRSVERRCNEPALVLSPANYELAPSGVIAETLSKLQALL